MAKRKPTKKLTEKPKKPVKSKPGKKPAKKRVKAVPRLIPPPRHPYTVVGYYLENDQPWASYVWAPDWEAAIDKSSTRAAKDHIVVVCGVYEGMMCAVDEMDLTCQIIGSNSDL